MGDIVARDCGHARKSSGRPPGCYGMLNPVLSRPSARGDTTQQIPQGEPESPGEAIDAPVTDRHDDGNHDGGGPHDSDRTHVAAVGAGAWPPRRPTTFPDRRDPPPSRGLPGLPRATGLEPPVEEASCAEDAPMKICETEHPPSGTPPAQAAAPCRARSTGEAPQPRPAKG